MKKAQYVLTLILTLVIVIFSLPPTTVFANNDNLNMRYGRKKLGQMPNGANMLTIYDELVIGCGNALAEININIDGLNIDAKQDFATIFKLFYSDYPEYFWLNNGGYNISYTNTSITIKPIYIFTGTQLEDAKLLFNAKVNSFISDLNGSDYDKAKTLHDRLINSTAYVDSQNDQNAYGALVEGKAVCNGYSRAYQHLLLEAGIPAWYVAGKSINPATNMSENHAWNVVQLDNDWYYTDITWDDQSPVTYYEYFNLTQEQLLNDHQIDDFYLDFAPTTSTSTSMSFYKKNNSIFDKYDQKKLVELLKRDGLTTQIYINGDRKSFLNSVDENLLSIAQQLGATGVFKISYSASTLKKAMVLSITIDSDTPIIISKPSNSDTSSTVSNNTSSNSTTSTSEISGNNNTVSDDTTTHSSADSNTLNNQSVENEDFDYEKSLNIKRIVIGSSTAFIIVISIISLIILAAKK